MEELKIYKLSFENFDGHYRDVLISGFSKKEVFMKFWKKEYYKRFGEDYTEEIANGDGYWKFKESVVEDVTDSIQELLDSVRAGKFWYI